MPEYTLDFIGRTLVDMRDRLEAVERRLGTLEATNAAFRDELTVTSAMVMRYSSDHIAWGAMERQIKSISDRLERVENRIPGE